MNGRGAQSTDWRQNASQDNSLPGRVRRDSAVELSSPADIEIGEAKWLIPAEEFRARFPNSPIFHHPHFVDADGEFRETAFEHPCMVIGKPNSKDQVLCFPETSFGGQDVRDKYRGSAIERRRYLEIEYQTKTYVKSSDGTPVGHDGTPLLKRCIASPHSKRAYINVQRAYCIEAEALKPWTGGNHDFTIDSVHTAIEHHNRHLSEHVDGLAEWLERPVSANTHIPLPVRPRRGLPTPPPSPPLASRLPPRWLSRSSQSLAEKRHVPNCSPERTKQILSQATWLR